MELAQCMAMVNLVNPKICLYPWSDHAKFEFSNRIEIYIELNDTIVIYQQILTLLNCLKYFSEYTRSYKHLVPRFQMAPTYSLMPDSWRDLARALVAELIGTMLLVLIGCGAAVNWKTSFDVTQVLFVLFVCWATRKIYQNSIVFSITRPLN